MKPVRTEQVQMAVSCYLKRRQYVDSDGPLKQGLRLSHTAEEMAANLTVHGSHDRTARLWSFDRTYPLRIYAGHLADVDCVRFHPNSNTLATGSTDKTVRLWSAQQGNSDQRSKLWDLASGTLFKELRGHTDSITSLAFSPDSGLVASASVDNSVRIWDLQNTCCSAPADGSSNELVGVCTWEMSSVLSVQFMACNLLLVTGITQENQEH
ncbi:TAF5-like RNA polymerase II p300/CBP-associated factor-associated factor 65 kDa subunit 5L [Heterocephalus glaber]|uniref:TAF5-like RNA polymerase II p300/CBP-associated factor-associated factor 65 kDa subunit 5L n=1 Tax=Heterocephalus glaber TaxID=10181 RepID=G5B1V9_HETGA|nr:TAF5-like RNA polymerase II p300/CBP-associated factor-associated factor 65 kDa subunit 5L [Heterocephalus glaber]